MSVHVMSLTERLGRACLLGLLLLDCGPRSVDVIMDPTATPGEFHSEGVGDLTAPIPQYPELARRASIQGRCRVSLRFAAGWTAESVIVARPSGNAAIDASSRSASAGVVLEPASCARLRTPVHAEIEYYFTLYRGATCARTTPSPDSEPQALVEVAEARVWTE